MQKVIMVNPKWDRGIIDKMLVVPLHCNYITPIHHYDVNLLSHVQYAAQGDYVFRARHYLDSDTVELEQYLVCTDTRLIKSKELTITDNISIYLDELQKRDTVLFSIFKGIDMSIHEMFDCDIESRKNFLTPLRFVDDEMYQFIISELQFSRELDCDTEWNGAVKLPRWLNSRERLVINNAGETVLHTSEHWMLFHEDGSVTFPDLDPTKGAKISQESQRTLEVYTAAPVPLPETTVKAIKITIGANPVGETMRGVSWNLYKRKK